MLSFKWSRTGYFNSSPATGGDIYKGVESVVDTIDDTHALFMHTKGYGVVEHKDMGAAPENKMMGAPKENKAEFDAQKDVLIAEGAEIGLKLTKNMKPETMRTKIDAEKEKQALEAADPDAGDNEGNQE